MAVTAMLHRGPARVRAAKPLADALAWWLFAAALTLSMTLSAPALLALGIPYDAPWGPAAAKLHPGSYVLVVAALCALLRHGNPLGAALESARRQPLLTLYLVCMVLVFVWAIYRHGSSGAAYIVQTLWMPALALFTLALLTPVRRPQAAALVMVLLGCNAVLALAEAAFRFHFVPVPPELQGADHFRATALLGHPLLNANITMALLPAALLLPWHAALRVLLALLLLGSVLAFGARTAFAVGLVVYGTHAAVHVVRGALRGRYSYLQITGGAAAVLLGAAALAALAAATGLGDRIFNNLTWDNSADVRLRVWNAFDHLRGSDWWLGVTPLEIDAIATALGLDIRFEAIENFWIYAFLQFGLIGFVPFALGLGCLIALLLHHGRPSMRSAVLVFFLIASTANALSSKTASLTLLAVVVMATAGTGQRRHGRLRPGVAKAPAARRASAGAPEVAPTPRRDRVLPLARTHSRPLPSRPS